MLRSWKIAASILVVLGCAAAGGCGSSSPETAVTAAIGGPGSERNPTKAGETGSQALAPGASNQGDPQHPVISIATNQGEIQVKLDRENAPLTVSNFLNYVDAGFYAGTLIHYVDPKSMILGGGFTEQRKPKPVSVAIRNEAHNRLKNVRGTIAMLRYPDAVDSATSQFFINVVDNPKLDYRDDTVEGYGYCVFGKVIGGEDVVARIAQAKVRDIGEFTSTPTQPIVIQSIRQIR